VACFVGDFCLKLSYFAEAVLMQWRLNNTYSEGRMPPGLADKVASNKP
jgi:hypothetical protein